MNFLEADVAIKVDDSKLPAQLAKARSLVTRTVTRIKASFSKMAASFKAAFNKMIRIAKYAMVGIVAALALATRAAMKQEDVLERLNIVLKSTAYAAGLTRRELVEHAKALQKVTVYGDETIEAMQALLLTFKSIRGEVFMRTTEAILDLSKAMGQDLQQSVIQVGKAINDPILGITALRRVGIQFTTRQEEMIRALVKSGKLFEAQSIILTELESQFGGMSRNVDTARGKLSQMWNALGDVAEVVGDALLAGFKDTTTAIKEWAERNQERIGYWAKVSVAYIAYVKDMLVSFIQFMKEDWRAGLEYAKDLSILIFEEMATKIKDIVKNMAADLVLSLEKMGPKMLKAVSNYWKDSAKSALGLMFETPEQTQRRLGKLPRTEDSVDEMLKKRYGVGSEAWKLVQARHKQTEDFLADYDTAPKPKAKDWTFDITPPELQTKFDEAAERLKNKLQEIKTTAEEIQEPMEKALVAPIVAAEEAIVKTEVKLTRVYQNIASAMAQSWADALDKMMWESKRFGDAMKDMFRSLLRMITQIIMYQVIAEPMAKGIIALIPGAVAESESLQHGGTVTKTGWAKVHQGETYSGVGGSRNGIVINVHNVPEHYTISEAEEYMFGDQRIIDVSMQAAEGNGPYRRAHKQIR